MRFKVMKGGAKRNRRAMANTIREKHPKNTTLTSMRGGTRM